MLDFTTSLTIGLPHVLQPSILFFAFVGSLIGLIVGALPGLTSAMAVSVMIPLTFTLSPEQAFALLLPAYAAGTFGGSLGAILLNIPGTGAAIMTAFDGYPMRVRGEAGRAIGLAATSSLIGGLVSALFLVAAAPVAARWAIQLGSHDFFAIAIFGLAIIAYISPSIVKGLMAGAFGLLLATVGNDPAGAFPRFTFGEPALVGGLTFVPVMIGLFGLAEIFWALENNLSAREPVHQKISGTLKSALEVIRKFPVLARSTVLGLFIGVMPASGPTIGSVVAYGTEKRIGKNRAKMGDGAPEGVIAAEAANNSGTGGALVPMMALGIPGDAVTAILIGALLVHGLQPGPALFLQQPELVSTLFLLFILGNILFVVIGLVGLRGLLRVLETPPRYLIPIVLAFCLVGAFAASNSVFDLVILTIFGIAGYVLRKADIPVAPVVLGFILGPLVEDNLRRALILDDGSPFGIFTRPFSATILVITVIMLISPVLSKLLLGRTLKLEE